MSRKKQWRLWLLSFLAIVALGVGATSQVSKLTAKETRADPPTIYPLTWKDDITARGGKLKYGLSQARNVTVDGKSIPAWVPNLTYMDNATTEIRHIFDGRPYNEEGYPSGSQHLKYITSTGAFNLVETDKEYGVSSIVSPASGVVVLTDVEKNPLGDKEEITGTGFKATEKGLEVSVKMVSNGINSAVSHIYEVKNTSGVEKTFYPIKHVDTQLNFDDWVVVRSRGPGKGLYIEGREQDGRKDEKIYRLDYIMDTEDSAQGIHQPLYYRGFDQGYEFSKVFGPDKDNQGTADVIKDMNVPVGEEVLPLINDMSDPDIESQYHDSGIYMSWGKVTIPDGGTYKMRYDVGIRPLAELEKTKTAENLTSKDGKNRVGDTIEYTITMKSPELAYKNLQVTDVLSEFFEHPTEDVTVTDVIGVNGNKTSYPIADVYNPTNRTLTVPKTGDEGLKIMREGEIALKFKVKLGANAAGQPIMNTAKVVGKTEEETTVDEEVTTKDPLPVENARPVTIKHVDMNGNPLVPAVADEIKKGNLGEVITITPTPLNGYAYDHASIPEPLKVTISTTDQEVLLYYSENRFTIKQEAVKADNSSATGVKVEEDINYTVTVESKLDASSKYKDFTISGKVTGVIENVDGFKLVSSLNPGVELAKPIYNPATGEFVATVQESDNVPSNANLIVTYTGKVEANAEPGDKITAEAKASGDYVNGLVATEIKATDFVSTVTAGQLIFESAPANMSFGENLGISLTNQDYPLANNDAPLSVKDLRGSNNQWSMVARVTKVLTNSSKGNHELPNALYYKKAGSNNLLEFEKDFIVTSHTTTSTGVVDISQTWNNPDDRPFVKVKGGEAKNGAYGGKIQWTLRNGL